MSTTASFPRLPSPVVEQSGWYPSERSAKSRLRSFFSRAKSQDKVPRQYVETFPPHPSVAPLEHTKRSRSTTWSKGPLRQPSRNVAADPPPLFHAYSQARKQEFLDIPSSFTDTLFRNGHPRRNSVSSETPSRSSLDKFPADGTLHKRNWSGASICSLSQKLFVLTTSGYVLQYSADGLNDRLPEKILELGPGSVAFASDAIPGKHWVLQISHDGASDHGAAGNKGSWSKWSFKHADNKRIVTDLFLVFDDARSFKDWLQVVRKEIAELGGLEYRPDSKHEDQMLPERRSLKAQRSLPSLPKSSSPTSPNDLPPLPLRNPSRQISRSTTDSSIHTLNDLDQLRKPSFSDSQSISTTHTSFTSSVMSYGAESFTSVDEPPLPVGPQSRLSTPTQDDIGELSMYMATPRKSISIPKRTTSLENTNDIIPHDLFVQKNDSSSTTGTYKSRPISTVAPLPEPGHIRKVSARHRYDLQNLPVQPATPAPSRPSSTRSRSSSHTSYNYSTKEHSPDALHRRAVSYSLFPKTPLSDAQAAAVLPSPPATTPGAAYESMCNYPLTPGSEGDKSRPSSRVGRVSSWRSNKMLSVDSQIAQSTTTEGPQRSPVVADSHFDTCFGTQVHPDAAARRKLSDHSSIGKITTTTLQPSAMDGPVPRIGQPPRKTRHVKGQKSMPALPRSVVMQPLGPPPSGPLPALPAEAPLSCLPLKKLSCMSGPERKPKPPPKHMKAESSDAVMTLRKLGKEPAPPKPLSLTLKPLPVPKAKIEGEKSAPQHTRNMSSISSVGSVTAWLASPRVAEFSAKYGLDDSDKENEGDGKFLQVALTNGVGFSAEFEGYMSP
ncbi:uncharacterized protein PV06_08565 [Exophiala oligosperma]|uniref:PH domain-containing protein n=1 Tax=Exophiala oligosperma TaxID=215243 RepID=A0A0D2DAA3_9EURO|nr:uncharacterized protein PV06_08565 [Exophiala oligosperma]KIW40008.1 hypothetical protein PV06_08565 [Exophiala oligosperma]